MAILQKLVFTKASNPSYSIADLDADLRLADNFEEVAMFSSAYGGTDFTYNKYEESTGVVVVERLWNDDQTYTNYKNFLGDALDSHRSSLENMGINIVLTETTQ